MKIDLSLVISIITAIGVLFGVLLAYLSSLRLRGTEYREEIHRVQLDKTREALETDIKRIYDEIYRDRGRWEEINHLLVDSNRAAKFRNVDEQKSQAVDTNRFLDSFGLGDSDLRVLQDQVFLLTPLSDEETPATNAVQAACERSGLRAIRGDEKNISGAILPVIIQEIIRSRFIIANLNGRNPNVFYEMGIAQALGKDVLMFAHRSGMESLPFDVSHQQIIFYSTAKQLHEKIIAAIAQLGWVSARSIRVG